MRAVPKPDRSTPFLNPDGKSISNEWDEFLAYLARRGVLQLSDVDNSTPITNTQVLIYNSTTGKLTPGSN